jgi:hypothetical protein
MPKFVVKGAFRETGKPAKVVVDATDAEDAARHANRSGLLVESVSPSADSTAIVPSRRVAPSAVIAPTTPPPMPKPWLAFVGEGQDPLVVERSYSRLRTVMTEHESLVVLVVQKKPVLNVSPHVLAATNRRVIVYRTKLFGRMTMEHFVWSKLSDAKLSEGVLGSTVSFAVIALGRVHMDYLPKEQARAFYRFAQQQEEAAVVTRRQWALEESRAAAGGVMVNNLTQPLVQTGVPGTSQSAEADPATRIRALKSLQDAGLIDQAEFDAKKAEILRTI